mmetsp:Transcript_16211/g.46140  ORF Transcript_16211/g.46140 Transcript_16211/m.46140 type:complete len:107 (-) Transcript_16211:622-942(-)
MWWTLSASGRPHAEATWHGRGEGAGEGEGEGEGESGTDDDGSSLVYGVVYSLRRRGQTDALPSMHVQTDRQRQRGVSLTPMSTQQLGGRLPLLHGTMAESILLPWQ